MNFSEINSVGKHHIFYILFVYTLYFIFEFENHKILKRN